MLWGSTCWRGVDLAYSGISLREQARLTEKCQPCPRTPVSYVPGLYISAKGGNHCALTSGPCFAGVPSLRCRGVGTRRRAIPGATALDRHPCRSPHPTTPALSLPTRIWRCLPERGTEKQKPKARAIFHAGPKPVGARLAREEASTAPQQSVYMWAALYAITQVPLSSVHDPIPKPDPPAPSITHLTGA